MTNYTAMTVMLFNNTKKILKVMFNQTQRLNHNTEIQKGILAIDVDVFMRRLNDKIFDTMPEDDIDTLSNLCDSLAIAMVSLRNAHITIGDFEKAKYEIAPMFVSLENRLHKELLEVEDLIIRGRAVSGKAAEINIFVSPGAIHEYRAHERRFYTIKEKFREEIKRYSELSHEAELQLSVSTV